MPALPLNETDYRPSHAAAKTRDLACCLSPPPLPPPLLAGRIMGLAGARKLYTTSNGGVTIRATTHTEVHELDPRGCRAFAYVRRSVCYRKHADNIFYARSSFSKHSFVLCVEECCHPRTFREIQEPSAQRVQHEYHGRPWGIKFTSAPCKPLSARGGAA